MFEANEPKYANISVHSDPNMSSTFPVGDDSDFSNGGARKSCFSAMENSFCDDPYPRMSAEMSPMMMSPWNQVTPFNKWSQEMDTASATSSSTNPAPQNALIGSLVREEGHIYSLASRGDLLYTGSDSKNIRVWKNLQEYSGFKSASGLVKAIVISGEKIFTGHQDGKIRVWKISRHKPSVHKRSGSLPTLKDIFKASIKPSNYVEVKTHRSALWIKHWDAVSCLSMSHDANGSGQGILYSASWDRTFKVWRISDSKCLESVPAHEDAVNSVVAGAEGMVFTGSADGTIKVWRRDMSSKTTKHTFVLTLLKQDCAVTALDVDPTGSIIYCGSSDGLVNFWEKEKNLAHGGVLRGHKLAVLCLAAKGRLAFSGSADKTICVWRRDDKGTGKGTVHSCLSVLSGHNGPVKCLAVEEDKKDSGGGGYQKWVVYSGSLDKSVKVWSVSDQPPHEMAVPPLPVADMDSASESLHSDGSSK